VKQNSRRANFAERAITLLACVSAFFQLACVTLPRYTPAQTQSSLSGSETQTDLRLNINTASAQKLEQLPGVGKVIAERIILHREQYGPFRREEHLMMVRGISDRKFRVLRTMIKVE
jgi:competence ComEA-like helix-hairpin-helix protein